MWLRLIPLSLWLRWASPSLQLNLGPLSLRLHCGLPDPRLCLSRLSTFASPWPSETSPSPWLVGSLSPPWSPTYLSSVGSTVGRLHGCGLGPSWLLQLHLPLSSPSWLLLSPSWLLPLSEPLWLLLNLHLFSVPALHRPLLPSHFHSFVFLLSPPPSHPLLFLRHEVTPSGRGRYVTITWTLSLF